MQLILYIGFWDNFFIKFMDLVRDRWTSRFEFCLIKYPTDHNYVAYCTVLHLNLYYNIFVYTVGYSLHNTKIIYFFVVSLITNLLKLAVQILSLSNKEWSLDTRQSLSIRKLRNRKLYLLKSYAISTLNASTPKD